MILPFEPTKDYKVEKRTCHQRRARKNSRILVWCVCGQTAHGVCIKLCKMKCEVKEEEKNESTAYL